MTSNWDKIIKRENSVCRLGTLFSEIVVQGSCKLFGCPVFRNKLCRRQILLTSLANSPDTDSANMWVDNSDFIVKITHYGEKADDDMLKMLDDFRYTWGDLDSDNCECGFECELLRLQEDVLKSLRAEI